MKFTGGRSRDSMCYRAAVFPCFRAATVRERTPFSMNYQAWDRLLTRAARYHCPKSRRLLPGRDRQGAVSCLCPTRECAETVVPGILPMVRFLHPDERLSRLIAGRSAAHVCRPAQCRRLGRMHPPLPRRDFCRCLAYRQALHPVSSRPLRRPGAGDLFQTRRE